MRANPRNIRDEDLAEVCEHYFGPPRTTGEQLHGRLAMEAAQEHLSLNQYVVRRLSNAS